MRAATRSAACRAKKDPIIGKRDPDQFLPRLGKHCLYPGIEPVDVERDLFLVIANKADLVTIWRELNRFQEGSSECHEHRIVPIRLKEVTGKFFKGPHVNRHARDQ
jgi:hypothetical protein